MSLPAATRPALSETDRVKTSRRPSMRSSVASAQTTPPTPTGTRWSNCIRLPTDVHDSGRCPSIALQLASSHRAISRGVASTGTVPERSAWAVSASVTVSSIRADRPVCGVTPVRYVTQAGVGQLAPVSYTHLRAHETVLDLVCRLLLEKKKKATKAKKDTKHNSTLKSKNKKQNTTT